MIEFKTRRIEEEWSSGALSHKLTQIIGVIAIYSKIKFKKNIVITGIYREQKEQDEIYGNLEEYKNNPWRSVHQFWRGVDLRSSIYTNKEITDLVNFVNNIPYDTSRPNKKTCTYHNVGSGDHIHVQSLE